MPDLNLITDAAIIGELYNKAEMEPSGWVSDISNSITSNNAEEEYGFLNEVPQIKELRGSRTLHELTSEEFKLVNIDYEGTLRVPDKIRRRDKTGQVEIRINEFAGNMASHWAEIMSAKINAGETGVCYDGQYYFDTDHPDGANGTQSNDITFDVDGDDNAGTPSTERGSVAIPSASDISQAVMKGLKQLYSLKNAVGRPTNQGASSFLVMTPVAYMTAMAQAFTNTTFGVGRDNPLTKGTGFTLDYVVNPFLTWEDKFVIFRRDSAFKPLIAQSELEPQFSILGPGSDHHFKNFETLFGLHTVRAAGYGEYRRACLVTLV